MEENVALDSSRQDQFIKSIKGIKKFMKKKSTNVEKVTTEVKPTSEKRKKKNKYQGKGLVYLSHIPHGFYEHQMTQYFKQFGRVTNARVIRSKRTGHSKGCAFVEFSEPSVGQIVAETMNNYLMGKRLLKAVYIPPEKQRRNVFRKNWSTLSNPGANLRKKINKTYNAVQTEEQAKKMARRLHSRMLATKQKLAAIGIDYGFFDAVDVPQFIIDTLNYKKEDAVAIPKEEIKESVDKAPQNNKDTKTKEQKTAKNGIQPEKKIKNKPVVVEEKAAVKVPETKKKGKADKKKDVPKIVPMENFITLKKEQGDQSDDDASDFDSDEYMRALANESSDESDSDAEQEQAAVKGNSKNTLQKLTQAVKKPKLNGNTKTSGFSNANGISNAEPTVAKKTKKFKKNKNPPQIAAVKRKAERDDQQELSRFSKKEKKSGVVLKNKKVKK